MRTSKDKLERIMLIQQEFQRITPDGVQLWSTSSPDQMVDQIRTQVLACTDELHEALGEVGWKPWATSRHMNLDAFQSELIDALRFLMNLFIISGLSPEGIVGLYEQSMKKTVERVQNGYDGVSTKCPVCHAAYDDDSTLCMPAVPTRGMEAYCDKAPA